MGPQTPTRWWNKPPKRSSKGPAQVALLARHLKWDTRFMGMARLVASWSKDRSTKVGCVVVRDEDRVPLALGYNGFPRGVSDDVEARHERPLKYEWTEHAERNAIYNAARQGMSLMECTLYCTHFPCMDCARAIVQSGIDRVVAPRMSGEMLERWKTSTDNALELFSEAGVTTVWFGEETP